MTYIDFKLTLHATGLTIAEFAALIGLPHRQAVTNYSKVGFVPDHFAVIVLLMVALVDADGDVRKALGGLEPTPKKPRGSGFKQKQEVSAL